jgi:hypothetical protein
VPLEINGMGEIGHLTREHGIYVNSAYRRPLRLLMQDAARYERAARCVSNGMMGADDLVPIAARMHGARDVIGSINRMRSAITSWDAVNTAISSGKFLEAGYRRAAQATSNVWCSLARTAGFPPAISSYTAIPGGSTFNGNTSGSLGTGQISLGASDHLYLSNYGIAGESASLNNTVISIAIDLLVAAGNISATVTTSQAISTTALPRWTTGEGLCMSLEVTTTLGTTASNVTLTYTDQGGTAANSTGAIALTTGATSGRLVPIQDGPMIRLAADDYGVRQVEGCILSASMGSGVLAAIVYKPLLINITVVGLPAEKTTPMQAGRLVRLTDTAGGSKPFITTIMYGPTLSTAGFATFVWG